MIHSIPPCVHVFHHVPTGAGSACSVGRSYFFCRGPTWAVDYLSSEESKLAFGTWKVRGVQRSPGRTCCRKPLCPPHTTKHGTTVLRCPTAAWHRPFHHPNISTVAFLLRGGLVVCIRIIWCLGCYALCAVCCMLRFALVISPTARGWERRLWESVLVAPNRNIFFSPSQ